MYYKFFISSYQYHQYPVQYWCSAMFFNIFKKIWWQYATLLYFIVSSYTFVKYHTYNYIQSLTFAENHLRFSSSLSFSKPPKGAGQDLNPGLPYSSPTELPCYALIESSLVDTYDKSLRHISRVCHAYTVQLDNCFSTKHMPLWLKCPHYICNTWHFS